MSLVFASICPHPPLIIPTIGRENLKIVAKTVNAMKQLERKIRKTAPEVILIVSPHGPFFMDAFTINLADKFIAEFKNFGDLTTHLEFNGNLDLSYKIRSALETKMPITMVTEPNLDHGASVPLYYLTPKLKNFSIIPITYSFLDYQTHLEFGRQLKEIFNTHPRRIAFIASGDLSHRLTFDAPAGYSPQGIVFDQKLITLLRKRAIKKILELDKDFVEEAGECGLRSILILLGILEGMNYRFQALSYEGPFGVGYLVANFKLKG
jgi:aromatic ring-opening dioxygenase LigB subunit